jgi:glyceraldehyde 3-phosphate dehydrogenase
VSTLTPRSGPIRIELKRDVHLLHTGPAVPQVTRVGINGFGRIGRAIFRINDAAQRFHVAAVNDIDPNIENHAYLLQYDSTYGRYPGRVTASESNMHITVDGQEIPFYAHADIAEVPWREQGVDVVVDASGVFQNVLSGRRLVERGEVRKLVVTHAPSEGIDKTIVFGVNEDTYDADAHHVVSTSICDANAAGPVLRLLEEAYGIEGGFITTLHPWLSYQNLVDGSIRSVSSPGHFWTDFSLGRASGTSVIPKDTTLVGALTAVLPDVARRLEAISFRVPTGIVSASDLSIILRREATAEEANALFREHAVESPRILGYQEDALVSVDFLGIEQSVVIDGRWTRVSDHRLLKLVLWYDNEAGYAQRVVDMVRLMSERMESASRG